MRVPVPRETDLTKVGFMEQTKAVCVGIEAIVERGITEAQQMVIEGVHLVPGFLDRSRWREAIVLEFVLAVTDKDRHRSNFTVRDWETGGVRPLRKYVEHFAQIRRIQKYIVGRAESLGVPVIDGVQPGREPGRGARHHPAPRGGVRRRPSTLSRWVARPSSGIPGGTPFPASRPRDVPSSYASTPHPRPRALPTRE